MLVFAHRGIHDRTIAENTLIAFQRALSYPIDGIELDVRVSRDKRLVVTHDKRLDRMAGDARNVSDLPVSRLRELPLRGQGFIPTLEEVLDMIPASLLVDIEIKERDTIEPLIKILQSDRVLQARVMISSFIFDALLQVRKALPDMRLLSLNRRWPLLQKERMWSRLKTVEPWGVGFPVSILNQRRVHVLREQGWQSVAWDLQHFTREAKKMAKLNVDIAITFNPDTIRHA